MDGLGFGVWGLDNGFYLGVLSLFFLDNGSYLGPAS